MNYLITEIDLYFNPCEKFFKYLYASVLDLETLDIKGVKTLRVEWYYVSDNLGIPICNHAYTDFKYSDIKGVIFIKTFRFKIRTKSGIVRIDEQGNGFFDDIISMENMYHVFNYKYNSKKGFIEQKHLVAEKIFTERLKSELLEMSKIQVTNYVNQLDKDKTDKKFSQSHYNKLMDIVKSVWNGF